ncbi:MAG TPA: VWA domain-containing protein [Candidatus Angelobacter sp.]|nr:VWA domain-containing protein [Candidatus Angelobacter sp.]
MCRRFSLQCCCHAFFLIIFAAICFGQNAGQTASGGSQTQTSQTTTLRVATRLVLVDVVASDKKGAPVNDLKAEEFTVQEEGADQPVQVFSFHHPGTQPEPPADAFAAPGKLPAGVYTNVPQYKTGGALNVVLLDALNSDLLDQAAMRDAMISFLEKVPAGEPIAIYLLGNKLTLVQDFTSDPELLRKAVASIKRQGSRGMSNAAGNTRDAMMPIGSVAADTMATMMPALQGKLAEFRDQQAAMQADFRVGLTLDALNALARSLAGYSGRKNLIWISESFPVTIMQDKLASNNNRDYAAAVARTGSMLSNAQVAIYTVDARGLAGSSQFAVGSDPNPQSSPQRIKQTIGGETLSEVSRETTESTAEHTTMNDLAEKTGGRAFYNVNNIEAAVRKSMDDGSTYYTLGYYPTNKDWDGKFRRITVKTNRPGVKLHYRQGYFAVEPESYARLDASQKSGDLARSLNLDFPTSTALRFQAAVMLPGPGSKKVTVNYAVNARQLTFELGTDGLQHASVDCAVIVYSQKGETLQTLSNTMVAALKPDEYNRVMQKSFPCRQSFEVEPGEYLLRLGVRDARTGLLGTLNAPLTVAVEQPAEKKQ